MFDASFPDISIRVPKEKKKKKPRIQNVYPIPSVLLLSKLPLVVGQSPRTREPSHWMGSVNPSSAWAFIYSIASCLYYMRNRYGLIVTGTDPLKGRHNWRRRECQSKRRSVQMRLSGHILGETLHANLRDM